MNPKQKKTTSKKMKIIGRKEYIDPVTGELEEMHISSIEDRDFNFEKIWLGHLAQALDIIGNKKMKVVTYIMQNRNNENLFIQTQREMEKNMGVSQKTINETIRALQEGDFLTIVHSGVYQLNPNIVFKGTYKNRMNILLKYEKNKKENSSEGEENQHKKSDRIKQRIAELTRQLEKSIREEERADNIKKLTLVKNEKGEKGKLVNGQMDLSLECQ